MAGVQTAPRPGVAVVGPVFSHPVRVAPPSVRRRQFLMSVAKHSTAIFFCIVFLTPFVFVLLTALMTQQQALSSRLWPSPF